MEKFNRKFSREFFAAQNSYFGFINHFDRIFDSEKYTNIFILKGGPGTGKSSIMKRVANRFTDTAAVTKIYCSSDINSLDGVIISNDTCRFAILDGTAPHERDAKLPGAVDELINLGEFWDSEALGEKREEIISLNKQKKQHYGAAYEFLAIAGTYAKKLKANVNYCFDRIKAKQRIKEICKNLEIGAESGKDLLLSAFGKSGYQTLPTAFTGVDEVVEITGGYFSNQVFLNMLCDEISRRGIQHTLYPSPLDPDDIETVVVSDNKKSIAYTTRNAVKKLSVEEFLNKQPKDVSTFGLYLSDYEKYESLAKENFSLASKTHFLLEDIYTPLMDFSMIDRVVLRIEKKISEAVE